MKRITNARGQTDADKAILLVVGLVVLALMAAFVLPIAIDAIEGDVSTTINQTTDETYEVNTLLESNVTATTADTDATIELNDTRTASTTSKTINEGENATYSLDGGNVKVTVDEAASGYAVVEYEYARDYTFGSSAQNLWGVLGLMIVLGVFLFVISQARNQF